MTGGGGRRRGRRRARSQWFVAGALAWQDSALCVVADDVFFDGDDTTRAKAVCKRCPVWLDCLEYGLHEAHGVWGGLTWAERARLQRLRRRLRLGGHPDDPENAKDISRLARRAGLSLDRLALALGLDAGEMSERIPMLTEKGPIHGR